MELLNKEFVGRKEEIQEFWNIYNNPETNYKVINYYGMTGMGKSKLLNEIEQELNLKKQNDYHIKLDMDFCLKKDLENSYFSQDEEDILLKMRNQLIDKYKFKFKLFDKALYQYYVSIGIPKEHPEMQMILSRNANVSQAVDLIKDFLGNSGIIITAIKTVDLGIYYVKKLLNNDKITLSPEILYENLAKCFAIDLQTNIEKKHISNDTPLVIFIDTYEMLIRESFGRGNQLVNDSWLKEDIVKPLDNVLWVIAGRDSLSWSKKDDEEVGIKKCELHNLSKTDTLLFLKNAGMTDETLNDGIYKKCEGMPMYLNLCIDRYNDLKEKNSVIDISCFGDNLEKLSNNIIRNMSIEDQEILSYLSCMDNWNDDFIRNNGSKFITCFSYIRYNNLKNRSFIEKNSNGQYSILKIAKNLLNKNCDTNIKQITKENLSKYYTEQLQSENLDVEDEIDLLHKYIRNNIKQEQSDDVAINMLENIKNHLSMLDKLRKYKDLENILIILWERFKSNKEIIGSISKELIQTLIRESEYKVAEKYVLEYEKIYEKELPESKYFSEYVASQDLKGEVALYRMKYDEAFTIFDKAHKERPEDLHIQEQLALVYGRKNQNRKSIEMLLDVLSKEEKLEGIDEAKIRLTKRNIANAYSHCGEYQKAVDIYDSLINTVEDELEQASLKNNKSNSLGLLGKNEEALKIIEEAYETRKEILGEKHLGTIATLNNMANILSNIHRFEEAMEKYNMVYMARKEKLGEDNDDTLKTLNNEAMTYFFWGRIDEALNILIKVYKIQSKKYSEEDLRVILILNNLARIYCSKGENEKALEMAEKAYDTRLKILGPVHLDTLTTATVLGNIYLKLGQKEKGKLFLEDTLAKAREAGYDEKHNLIIELESLLKEG